VLKAGTGTGTITSNPAGIDCGADCGESYTSGTPVTLTATPSAGSTFTGWSGGGCAGTGPCVVTMNVAHAVTATFTATATFALTVAVAGNGGVVSNPAGIGCPSTCTASFPSGTSVVLSAIAAQGATFQGWSGAGCTGTGTCTVAMTQAQSVSATFAGGGGGGGGVQATVDSTRITKTGPFRARRQLKVTVTADEDLRRIAIRIKRNGITIQSKIVRNFDADTAVLNMNIRNGIASGRAQLQVVFTDESGEKKTQTRGIRIPSLF
jgi:hypothetical protein